jgi:integrase
MKRRGLPKYCSEFQDRHGKWRVRARRKGYRAHYFVARPGTDAFADEYRRWLAGEPMQAGKGGAGPAEKAGTVTALVTKLYRSGEWAGLGDSTKATYRGIIERFRAEHGDKPVALMERRHVRDMVAAKATTPAAANNLLRMIRMLMRFAIEEGWRVDDPTAGVKAIKTHSDGFHTWTEDEIAAFEAHWPIGSMQRLAFALLLYTGQRRSDAVTMGRQHMRAGRLHVVQQKTGARLAIPVHPELQTVLDGADKAHLTFLVTSHGKPFTAAGFGNWFRAAVDAAGLPKHCSAHGLRKAACRRLAEAGCSANQIAAVSGHATLREVTRYTAAADQERLADAAMPALGRPNQEQELSNPVERLAISGSNPLKKGGH